MIAEHVVVIDTIPGLRLDAVSEGTFTFVFAGSAPSFAAGDIIVGTAGNGFLRRVVSSSAVDSTLTIETADAALTDAIIDGGFDIAVQLPIEGPSGQATGLPRLRPVHLARGVVVTDEGIELSGLELFAGSVEGVDLSVTVTRGSVDFRPSIDVGVEIASGSIREFHTLGGGHLDMVCDLTMAAGGPVTHSGELHLATFESVINQYIGPVPVTEVITLRFDAGFTIDVETATTLEYESEAQFDLLFGGRTHDEGWLSIWNPSAELDGNLISWPGKSHTAVDIYVRPTIEVAFYGVSGSSLVIEPFVTFTGEMISGYTWQWALAGGVDGRLRQDLSILEHGLDLIQTEFAVLNKTIDADSGITVETWERTIGGSGSEQVGEVKPTPDGGFVVVGSSDSYGVGGWDAYLVKIDAFGTVEWEQTFGGADLDLGHDVVAMPDGGYVIAGETRSFGAGNSRAWVIKTNAVGVEEWSNRFGLESYVRAIDLTMDGGFIVAGRGRLKPPNTMGLYLAKLDADGYVVWETTFPQLYTAADVIALPTGEYVATGYMETSQYADALLLKVDAQGNKVWSNNYGGYSLDFGESLVLADDGSLVVAGSSRSFGGGSWDIYLLRAAADGDLRWSRGINSTEDRDIDDTGRSIAKVEDGGYVIVGRSATSTAELGDAYLIRINSLGTRLWQRFFGGEGLDEAESVALALDGGLIIAGQSSSFGDGGADIYLIKTDNRGLLVTPVSGARVITRTDGAD
ncbi:MAG TPA: hypothetical protein VM118_05590 [Acidobacteriota bacterium]|nr:hypothetical protein [Acidobacteriota bacterium]